MKEKLFLVVALNIIGLTFAHITPAHDGGSWGILNRDLSMESGSVITDAVLTIVNIRPDNSCLNPAMYIHLLGNATPGFTQIEDKEKSTQNLFENEQTPALSAQWKLNESEGYIAPDSSGNNNPAALMNNPAWIAGEGISFQANQYLSIADSVDLDAAAPMALSLWFKMQSPVRFAKLLIKPYQSRSTPWELYALDLGSDGMTPRFLLSDGIPGGQYVVAYNHEFKVIPDRWYHIAGTYDGSQMHLYVDGRLVSRAATNLQIGSNSMPLCIGGRLGADTFDGIIRDVRIYNRSVSSQPIQFVQSTNLFENYGTFLKKIESADLGTASNFSFSLQQIENPNSWVRTIYGTSFAMPFPGRATPLSFSSSLLELLDYAGTGFRFGIGFDSDGFLFDKITLTITTESYLRSEEPKRKIFTYQNRYAPMIISPTSLTMEPGKNVSFTVTTFEPDNNPHTVSAKNLPPGAAFSNNLFSWTPAPEQIGLWTVIIEATDGIMTTQKYVQIQVADLAPIFTPVENPVLYEFQRLNLPIRAVDLAGNPVPITAFGLPDNASFDGSTLLWRPLSGEAGIYQVTFSASNEIRQEEMTITITVLPYQSSMTNKPILVL